MYRTKINELKQWKLSAKKCDAVISQCQNPIYMIDNHFYHK